MKHIQTTALLLAFSLTANAGFNSSGLIIPGDAKRITCTTDSIKLGDESAMPARNPIAEALQYAGPGCHITLKKGDYPAFTIGFDKNSADNARTSGGLPGKPIVVIGQNGVRIMPNTSTGDTIAIAQQVPNGHFVFRNLVIKPGYRAGVIFFKQGGSATHDDFKFLDCDIKGDWSHASDKGERSKWALWGHSMRDFVFRGETRQVRIEDIQKEHAFYIQNPQGSILIENVLGRRLGRTFCQFTARAKDGLEGTGSITVRNCEVADIGIAREDAHKGGSAFTFAGRLTGTILVVGNRYRAGFNEKLSRLTNKNTSYGTGALVCWDAGETVKNRRVIIKDNDFEFAKGCGDRPVVAIGGCGDVFIEGKNRFISGGNQPAISLDPRQGNQDSPLVSAKNGHVFLSKDTKYSGKLLWRGKVPKEGHLRELQTPPKKAAEAGSTSKK